MNDTALAVRTSDKQLDALREIAKQATPTNEIRTRPGRGGMQLKYTDGAYVIRTLNQAFGWDWDFVADNEELLLNNGQPFEVKVRGTLIVRLNGQAVTKTQFGCQPIEILKNGSAPVSIGDCYKGAATDALKKCASMLGIALDLYDSDSAVNTGKVTSPPPQAHPVTTDTGPDRSTVKNPKHSPEMAKRFNRVIERLTIHRIKGDELLRETNSILHDSGLKQVLSRYEVDDEGATIVCKVFEEWADTLDRKAGKSRENNGNEK